MRRIGSWGLRKIDVLIFVLVLTGCAEKQEPFSILGNWSGTLVTITDSALHESVTKPVKRFGYLNLELHGDSTYLFDLAVLKDVTTERTMFGIPQNVILLKAVYTTSRFGRIVKGDTDFICASKESVIFVEPDSVNGQLIARFRDRSNRNWVCTF
ncbi:MAG: hypothetical protein ACHQNE_09990, partial [Candidatus Kapaibacterium sp.]